MSSAADHPGDAAGRAGWHAMAIAGPFRGPARVDGSKRKPEGVRKHEGKGNVIEPSRIRASRQRAWGVGTNADALAAEPSRLGLRNEGVYDDVLEGPGTTNAEAGREARNGPATAGGGRNKPGMCPEIKTVASSPL